MMGLYCLSFHHIRAPYKEFRKVRFSDPTEFYKLTKDLQEERVLIQTGTRIEVYGIADDPNRTITEIIRILSERSDIPEEELKGYFKTYQGREAALHLFRMVSCIESRVLGETYIPWQATDGARVAKDLGTLGRGLGSVFKGAFKALVISRKETGIQGTEKPALEALTKLNKHIEDFHGRNVVLYGAGLSGRRLATALKERGALVRVLNRNLDIGKRTAREVGGDVIDHSNKLESISWADVLICATLASHYRVIQDIIQERDKPLYVVDLSPFGNVDPNVGELDSVILVNGTLRSSMEENRKVQMEAVPEVEKIIEQELNELVIP